MHNMAEEESDAILAGTKEPMHVTYPSFSLHKKVPESIMSQDVGKSLTLQLEVRISGKHKTQNFESIEFEIHEIGVLKGSEKGTVIDEIKRQMR
jgi:hypothetical protein